MQPTRSRIRKKYGLEEQPYSDCLSTTLLCCFAICQESAEIDVRPLPRNASPPAFHVARGTLMSCTSACPPSAKIPGHDLAWNHWCDQPYADDHLAMQYQQKMGGGGNKGAATTAPATQTM